MNLFAEANNRGIQTEFVDGQGHRRVTDVAALEIILNALPPQTPGPLLGQPVVVRHGRPARSELRPAARFPVGWKIVSDGVVAEGETSDRVIDWPEGLPAGVYRLQLTDAADGNRGRAADLGAGKSVRRRFRPLLAARGTALRRPLGAQLGDRRLHRSRSHDRICGRSRRRRYRPQSAARLVRRSSRRLQPLFAEQSAVSQRALCRCRQAA